MIPMFPLLFYIILNYYGLSEQKVQPEIVILGNTIAEQLANKTKENADSLYKNLFTYLESLQEINGRIWSENGEVVLRGMGIFDDLEDAGGPPHITCDLDYKQLGWNNKDEIEQVKSVVKDTKKLWEAVKDRANRLRIGTWGVDSKVEETVPAQGDEESDGELH